MRNEETDDKESTTSVSLEMQLLRDHVAKLRALS